MNVPGHGYPVALINVSIVAVLFLVVSFGALVLDRRVRAVRARPAWEPPHARVSRGPTTRYT